jgi:hypothetical protein
MVKRRPSSGVLVSAGVVGFISYRWNSEIRPYL